MDDSKTYTENMDFFDENYEEKVNIHLEDYSIEYLAKEIMFDFTIPLSIRLEILLKVQEYDSTLYDDCCSRLVAMFNLQNVSVFRKFFLTCCTNPLIDSYHRILFASTLCTLEDTWDIGWPALIDLLKTLSDIPGVLRRSEIVELWLRSQENYIVDFVKSYLTKSDDTAFERLCVINSFINRHPQPVESAQDVIMYYFYVSTDVQTKISLAYMLLQLDVNALDVKNNICESLLELLESVDEKRKGEIYDILLSSKMENYVNLATSGLKTLGESNNVYESKQNVHFDSVQSSTKENMAQLFSLQQTSTYTLEEMFEYLYVQYPIYKKELTAAYQHIYLDNTQPIKLSTYVTRLWSYINTQIEPISQKTYIDRFVEEIVDMNDTCTSGYFSRIAAVLTGHLDFGITISIRDQLRSDIKNEFIELVQQSDEAGDIACNMIDNENFNMFEYKSFLNIYMTNVEKIRDKLYGRYSADMTDQEFDEIYKDIMVDMLFT
jgi:hypothetical protein